MRYEIKVGFTDTTLEYVIYDKVDDTVLPFKTQSISKIENVLNKLVGMQRSADLVNSKVKRYLEIQNY